MWTFISEYMVGNFQSSIFFGTQLKHFNIPIYLGMNLVCFSNVLRDGGNIHTSNSQQVDQVLSSIKC